MCHHKPMLIVLSYYIGIEQHYTYIHQTKYLVFTTYALHTWSWVYLKMWERYLSLVLKMGCNAVSLPLTLTLGCHDEWMKNDHLYQREYPAKYERKVENWYNIVHVNVYVETRYPVGLESNSHRMFKPKWIFGLN